MIRFPVRKSVSPLLSSVHILFVSQSCTACVFLVFRQSTVDSARTIHARLVHSCIQTFHSAIVGKKIIASPFFIFHLLQFFSVVFSVFPFFHVFSISFIFSFISSSFSSFFSLSSRPSKRQNPPRCTVGGMRSGPFEGDFAFMFFLFLFLIC